MAAVVLEDPVLLMLCTRGASVEGEERLLRLEDGGSVWRAAGGLVDLVCSQSHYWGHSMKELVSLQSTSLTYCTWKSP